MGVSLKKKTVLAWIRHGAAPAAAALFLFPSAFAADSLEHELKSAYIYNFIRFVEWPPSAQGDIVVCVAGPRPVVDEIRGGLSGKEIGDRAIRVRGAAAPVEVAGCEVLYVTGRDSAGARRFLAAVPRHKVLTITESDRFPASGSLINFFLDNQTVRFAVNADLLPKTQFKLSSQMLQFGTMVSARDTGKDSPR